VDRRTFLKGGLAASGLAGIGAAIWARGNGGPPPPARNGASNRRFRGAPGAPNILVILVDQLRFPSWFSPVPGRVGLPPNLAALQRESVSFERHYTAANDCTPSRSALLTGLYSHQTGCLTTGASTLDPGFPTWGTMLREHGYETYWYGKWHLTRHDRRWTAATGPPILERYGFAGGTFPSPNGAPGQGWRADPHITEQFAHWYAHEAGAGPWCTTVSLVNPHDIAWWYEVTDRERHERSAPRAAHRLPPNFETPEEMIARNKPRLQRSLQDTSAASFGPVPFTGPLVRSAWLPFLDLYAKLQREVDDHIGRVLRTLRSRPEVAANTVIVFTSDHGEYAASHGLRGKGAGAYEEGIRVPLLVKDPRGKLTRGIEQPRTQLTSSVDVAPLLLTIATGSSQWRREDYYSHLAGRLELEQILIEPRAPGRPHVVHATDEIVTEYATQPYAADAPLHVIALRTPQAKYAVYANWTADGLDLLPLGQESELYDYRTSSGRLELHNSAGENPLDEAYDALLLRALSEELRAVLPGRLAAARAAGLNDYLHIAKRAARADAARRRRERERSLPRRGVPPNTVS
jgi:arylsulfatase A-like enzyme